METNYVGYEYTTKTVAAKDEGRATDKMAAFGWEITDRSHRLGSVTLNARRDRKINHRTELNRLERKADTAIEEIVVLEKSAKKSSNIFAYIFGSLSALVMGTGMSMCLVMLDYSWLFMAIGVAVGVIGIVLCSINYPIYRRKVARKTANTAHEVDEKYEIYYTICEQAHSLLEN